VSHIVEIQTEVRDSVAVAAACQRLGLPEPVHGTAKLFEGEAAGSLVKLPGWLYPIVIDTSADCGCEKATMPFHFVLSQVAR
jgi:hypothetical protein